MINVTEKIVCDKCNEIIYEGPTQPILSSMTVTANFDWTQGDSKYISQIDLCETCVKEVRAAVNALFPNTALEKVTGFKISVRVLHPNLAQQKLRTASPNFVEYEAVAAKKG